MGSKKRGEGGKRIYVTAGATGKRHSHEGSCGARYYSSHPTY